MLELPDAGKRLYHAQLHYKPFRKLLRVVFVLDADEDPAMVARPTTLFATDPKMAPKQIYRIYRDRFQIEFNFRDAKQHLGLAACQARTAERHHFHLNAVLAALAWTRLELRHAAQRGPGPLFDGQHQAEKLPGNGTAKAFGGGRAGPDPAEMPRGPAGPPGSGPNRAPAHLNPRRIQGGFAAAAPIPASPTPIRTTGATAPATAYLKNCSHHC